MDAITGALFFKDGTYGFFGFPVSHGHGAVVFLAIDMKICAEMTRNHLPCCIGKAMGQGDQVRGNIEIFGHKFIFSGRHCITVRFEKHG